MQQKAQLILIELDAATAASSTPTTLTTAHAVHISRVGSRLVPLRPASAVEGSRGADETAALVCSVELRDGGATSLLRLGTLVQVRNCCGLPLEFLLREPSELAEPAARDTPRRRIAHGPPPRLAATAAAAAATRCAGARGLEAFELVRVGGPRTQRLDDLGLAHAAVAQHHDHVPPRARRGGRLRGQAVVHLLLRV